MGSGGEGARTIVWLIRGILRFPQADSKGHQTISALSPGLQHGAGELPCGEPQAWACRGECLPPSSALS